MIRVEHLGKKYLIRHQQKERYTALRDVIAEKTKKIFSIGRRVDTDNATGTGNREEFWALKDVNFEVNRGDRVGIIGRNGAGKSTLLKILSRITEPTEGRISIKGRIASLLEVGTGFHAELTGRENIFLNGAILGMHRWEIKKKFDEIVDFSGVEKFLDTPVKRYSSGMYVRLAFAVAAHLESEILIVDEVLAVGDMEFQKKCLSKMNEISQSGGRTVLFVSHNMAAIKNLCTHSLLVERGKLIFAGQVEEGINKYLSNYNKEQSWNLENLRERSGNGRLIFSSFHVENENGEAIDTILTGENVVFVFKMKALDHSLKNIDIGFSIHDLYDTMLTYLYSGFQNVYFESSTSYIVIKCLIKNFPFSNSRLTVQARVLTDGQEADWPRPNLGIIDVQQGDFFDTGKIPDLNVPFLIKGNWDAINL